MKRKKKRAKRTKRITICATEDMIKVLDLTLSKKLFCGDMHVHSWRGAKNKSDLLRMAIAGLLYSAMNEWLKEREMTRWVCKKPDAVFATLLCLEKKIKIDQKKATEYDNAKLSVENQLLKVEIQALKNKEAVALFAKREKERSK